MPSIADTLKKQLKAARKEYRTKRRELERAIAKLDRQYGALLGFAGGGSDVAPVSLKARSMSGRKYGGVREAVLGAIRLGKGIKPKDIVAKTGLASAQVHNSLTALKKDKLVRVKGGLYTAA